MAEAETTNTQNQQPGKWKLTKVVKRFVDVLSALTLITFILFCFYTLIVGISIPSDPDERHTDINFQFNFIVYPELEDGLDKITDDVSEIIKGDGYIKLNNTQSRMGWFIQNLIKLVMLVFLGFALRKLQKLFKNLEDEQFFHPENPVHIKEFGFIVIAMSIVAPIITYLGGMVVLADVGQLDSNIEIYPVFYLPVGGFFFGLTSLLLAQIMKEASDMREEQELTI